MLHQDLHQNLAYAEVELERTLFVFYPVLEPLCYKNSEKSNQLRFIWIFKLVFSVTTGLNSSTNVSNRKFSVLADYTEETMHFLVCGELPIVQKLSELSLLQNCSIFNFFFLRCCNFDFSDEIFNRKCFSRRGDLDAKRY